MTVHCKDAWVNSSTDSRASAPPFFHTYGIPVFFQMHYALFLFVRFHGTDSSRSAPSVSQGCHTARCLHRAQSIQVFPIDNLI